MKELDGTGYTRTGTGRPELPEGAHLAYACLHEIRAAWKGPGGPQEVSIFGSMKGSGGGQTWSFEVSEHDLGGPCIKVQIYNEMFRAFAEIPQFFAALARNNGINTMAGVLGLLQTWGAVDETPRVEPSAPRRDRLRAAISWKVDQLLEKATHTPVGSSELADAILDALGETNGD